MEAEPFKVSVVIPAFNEEARIAHAVAAIRLQSEAPHEIIVVDDGSKDETSAVASGLGVRVIRQSNGGIAAARNTGIRMASGAWIAFCDADDEWHPDMLALARKAHETRPSVDFIFADHCTSIDGEITLASMFRSSPAFAAAAGVAVSEATLLFERQRLAHALVRANFIAPSTAVVRRAFVVDHDILFTPGLPSAPAFHVAEDIEWYLRVLSASDGLAIDRVMLTYHRHPGSVSDNPGRIRYGNAKLGEVIAANPARYAPGVAATYAAMRRQHIREAAIDDLRTLRFRDARIKLREAQALAFRLPDAALGALSAVAALPGGAWTIAAGRRLWRSRIKPAVRVLRRPGR